MHVELRMLGERRVLLMRGLNAQDSLRVVTLSLLLGL